MYRILKKERLNDAVSRMEIEAPFVAKHAKPGQFVLLQVDDHGERIPLTVAGTDHEKQSVTVIYQKVGYTTMQLDEKEAGDFLAGVSGPLGKASKLEGIGRACVVGGGVGCAIAYPQAVELHRQGTQLDVVVGFRTRDLIILEEDFRKNCDRIFVMTDDGSNGNPGFVTAKLRELLEGGAQYDEVIAIGPLPMMKAVCDLTREYGIKTTVSMNPIMIDGTGMCGGCRVTVGGERKFACVDGPDFDGHLVDFDETIKRTREYKKSEDAAMAHYCRLKGVKEHG